MRNKHTCFSANPNGKVKVKVIPQQAEVAQRGSG